VQKPIRRGSIEKHLYLSILGLARGRVFGILYALYGRPETGSRGTVTLIGISAQPDAFFGTLEIGQFASFDPQASGPP
jgi:hypothetical protein